MGNRNLRMLAAINPKDILNQKITVSQGEQTKKLSPVEVGYRNLLNSALSGDMKAIKRMVNECVKAGILVPRLQEPYQPSGLHIPKDWDNDEWHANYDKHGFPPWPGDKDGFTDEDRAEYEYWRKHGHHSWRDQE